MNGILMQGNVHPLPSAGDPFAQPAPAAGSTMPPNRQGYLAMLDRRCGGARVAENPKFQAYLAKRRADAEARRSTPEWEAQLAARKAARRPLVAFHTAKRKAALLQRTPAWADMAAIQAFYDEAERLTRETGTPHHVDHEIPLQGKLVSGLHVHNNLQILTGSENSKKHNRFTPE